ncbi:hypothetical protein BHYA_0216g00050 [Botrytis hyacinthi]|uniref:Uncharacterized protein n=1 Tax=Botrytis hyacinthi TaxID=278943 RepID=A0A4Z1GF17_9HELO|nr:hypothetical protein BHYA_0216g00050 [Botrytis hyacinthi]
MSSSAPRGSRDKDDHGKLGTQDTRERGRLPRSSSQPAGNRDQPSIDEKRPPSSSHGPHRPRRSDGKSNSTTIPSRSRGPHNRKQLQDSNPIEKPKKGPTETESRIVSGTILQKHDKSTGVILYTEMDVIMAQWNAIVRKKIENCMNAKKEIKRLLIDVRPDGRWDENLAEKARDIAREAGKFDIQSLEVQEVQDDVKVWQNTRFLKGLRESLKEEFGEQVIERATRRYKELKN